MKKSSFVALILSTVGGILLALGMCMCLLPEWNLFIQGIVMGSVGLVVLFVMVLIWRKMEGKEPIRLSGKMIAPILLGTTGSILFGVGMSLTMVWSQMVIGVLIGILGIVMLLSLIPYVKGLR
ncbi:MAG: hypothetical protein K0R00_1020 [Herbinix sp.]|jgi:hypothetical protein|nr:hypothetical protein [Herbinix sp.]